MVNFKYKIVGIRPGEKLHEDIITKSDGVTSIDLGKYYAILPASGKINIKNYKTHLKLKKVPKNFSFNSGENSYLSVGELKKIINKFKLK